MAETAYLCHHGVKGQKWGVRRWQNGNGSLTPEGYIHYGYGRNHSKSERTRIARSHKSFLDNKSTRRSELSNASVSKDLQNKNETNGRFTLTDKQKRNIKIALGVTAAVAVTAGVMYYSKNKRFYSDSLTSKKLDSDFVLKKGSKIQNLSFDKNRMDDVRLWRSNGDMMYASHTARDNAKYMAYYATNPKAILEGKVPPLKYRISGHVLKNVKVASEKSGAAVFSDLFRTNDEFRNFVTDPSKMREYYVSRVPKQFSGYKEALTALDRVSSSNNPSDEDLRMVYRLFNYTIPHEECAQARAKFFSKLKRSGYGALLDTNDALYGGFHSESPVIIFDMENVTSDVARDLTYADVLKSVAKNAKNALFVADTSVKLYG